MSFEQRAISCGWWSLGMAIASAAVLAIAYVVNLEQVPSTMFPFWIGWALLGWQAVLFMIPCVWSIAALVAGKRSLKRASRQAGARARNVLDFSLVTNILLLGLLAPTFGLVLVMLVIRLL